MPRPDRRRTRGRARRPTTISGPATANRPAGSSTATSRPGCRPSLLAPQQQAALVDALCAAAAQWDVALHFNKGIAGAPAAALDATRDTAMNPAVLDAFALAIIAGGGGPAFPGMPGAAADEERAPARGHAHPRRDGALLKAAPNAGAYVSESDYFQPRLAGRLLGRQLRTPGADQGDGRSGRAVLRPPRRRQRGLERRRLHQDQAGLNRWNKSPARKSHA